MTNPADIRTDYTLGGLDESDLASTPWEQWQRWWAEALDTDGILEPNAMSLATADAQGRPSVRTVLLKSMEPSGLTFFTNLGSRKSTHLRATPHAAVSFTWLPLHRQVSVHGSVQEVTRAESETYFQSRPYESRLGAWASQQSAEVASRDVLQQQLDAARAQFPDTGAPDDVPLPENWGGWRILPHEIEFWQGRRGRLHDRLVFERIDASPCDLAKAESWRVLRRSP